jgi:hypothetical protein
MNRVKSSDWPNTIKAYLSKIGEYYQFTRWLTMDQQAAQPEPLKLPKLP